MLQKWNSSTLGIIKRFNVIFWVRKMSQYFLFICYICIHISNAKCSIYYWTEIVIFYCILKLIMNSKFFWKINSFSKGSQPYWCYLNRFKLNPPVVSLNWHFFYHILWPFCSKSYFLAFRWKLWNFLSCLTFQNYTLQL